MVEIKLVSINIERSKHLDTVIPFVHKYSPDVITLQEVMQRDVEMLEKAFGMQCFFTPLLEFAEFAEETEGIEGIAIFAKSFVKTGASIYSGSNDPLHRYVDSKIDTPRIAKALVHAQVETDGKLITIATTHFTWSGKGETSDLQRKDFPNLLQALEKLPEFVLSGDLNAPRGNELWDQLASMYKDNIPAHYTGSIDPMHKAGELPYVVDALFTTPEYEAHDVEYHTGISDHKAITATISR